MQNIHRALSVVIITGFVILFSSCEKNQTSPEIIEIEFIDSVNVSNITNPQDAIERIRFKYENILLRWGIYNINTGILSGEYATSAEEFIELKDFSSITPLGYPSRYFWEGCYDAIALSSEFIQVTKNDPSGIAAQNTYLGQVYFYKALSYFTAVRVFGKFYPNKDFAALGVPIFSMDESVPFKRNTLQENFDLIIADLEKAALLLPESDPIIPTKYSAMALAAQAQMWFQNYDAAAVLLETIFQSNQYALVNDYANIFDGEHENSSESVFEFQYYKGGYQYYTKDVPAAQNFGYRLAMAVDNDNRQIQLSDFAVAQFGNDSRGLETYYGIDDNMYDEGGNLIVNKGGYPNIKKYTATANCIISESDVNICFIRLAELYLMYAEIQILKGNNPEASKYINLVRTRAKMPEILSPTMDDLMHEKFVELSGEGVYWFDIIRWNKTQELLGSRNFNAGKNEVLPIPQSVIDRFPNILQNSGY